MTYYYVFSNLFCAIRVASRDTVRNLLCTCAKRRAYHAFIVTYVVHVLDTCVPLCCVLLVPRCSRGAGMNYLKMAKRDTLYPAVVPSAPPPTDDSQVCQGREMNSEKSISIW